MNLEKSSLVRHIGLKTIRIEIVDPFGVAGVDICITLLGEVQFTWDANPSADTYNLYILEDDEIVYTALGLTDEIYLLDPSIIGDGTYTVEIYNVVGGTEGGLHAKTDFELLLEFMLRYQLEGSSWAQADEGDTLLLAYHYTPDITEILDEEFLLDGEMFYDLENRIIGLEPKDTEKFWQTNLRWIISDDFPFRTIKLDSGLNTRKALVMLSAGQLEDCEVFCTMWSGSETGALMRLHARTGINNDNSERSVFIDFVDGDTVLIRIYDSTGTTVDLDSISYNWSSETWYKSRIVVIGTDVKARVWREIEPEPTDWMLEGIISDSAVDKGFVGVGNFAKSSGSTGFDMYYKDFYVRNLEGVTIPETPNNFQATLDGNNVSFTWDAVAGVDGYNLYKRVGLEFEKVNTNLITGTSFEVENLDDGAYEYHVKSILSGIESFPNSDTFIVNFVYTDFSEYETGFLPSDWLIVAGAGTWTVEEKVGGEGGKSLRFTGQTSGQHFLRWDLLPVLGDMRVEGKFIAETKGGNTRLRLLSRLGDNETAYFPELTGFSSYDRALWRVVNGSFTNLNNDGSSGFFSAGIWYQMKIECVGTTIRCKFWEDGESEPETWLFSVTDSSISSGRAGVSMRVNSSSDLHWMDWIKVTPL